jgi:hypothetical protein
MAEISSHPRRNNKRLTIFALGGAILAGLAVNGAILQRNTLSPQMATSVDEIEDFLVEGWEETLGHPLEVSSSRAISEDWILLGDSAEESLNPQDY